MQPKYDIGGTSVGSILSVPYFHKPAVMLEVRSMVLGFREPLPALKYEGEGDLGCRVEALGSTW